MRYLNLLSVLMLSLFLASCGIIGNGDDCSWARPILVGDEDQLTEATARDILVHNEVWERLCSEE